MPLRVLIVEDETDFREGLCDLLNLEGFQAYGVGSFASYKAWRASNSCDLLILDRNLPDIDGLEILKIHRRTENTPAIMLTGAGLIEDRIQGMNADADYYLVKPVMTDELIAILKRFERKLNEAGQADAWMLDLVRWQITTPNSIKISLTKSEVSIMVSRDEVIEALGGDPMTYDPRRLEIAIRRLRKKMEDNTTDVFPLTTVYGEGYSFNSPISSL
jgi:two-component system, OmpR family, response regulator